MQVLIALIFALRIFSFMAILPVLSHAASAYSNYSIINVGIAIGIYGLLQAIFHIPMGFWSDRLGRRKVVLFGLILMLLGSIVAAQTHDLFVIIIARAIQGAGAIGSVLNAWCADITNEKDMTKAMALIGMTIGLSFFLAVMLGPIIVEHFALSGLFWLTALLAVISMIVVCFIPDLGSKNNIEFTKHIKKVLSNSSLLKIDYGIFALHASYTALFLVIPRWIDAYVGHANSWYVYLPIISVALLLSLPAMFLAEAKGKINRVLVFSAAMMFFSQLLLIISYKHWLVPLFIYFAAFTTLEALLPSLLARYAPLGHKGTAMGVFSCTQYLGIFVGGIVGGWILHHLNVIYLLMFSMMISLIWSIFSSKMPIIVIKK